MFMFICALVISTLVAMHFLTAVTQIRIGSLYADRMGNTIRIHHKIRVGDFDIFVGDNGVRYYANGERVGDNLKSSHHRLVKTI